MTGGTREKSHKRGRYGARQGQGCGRTQPEGRSRSHRRGQARAASRASSSSYRALGLGLAAATVGGLLAACGDSDEAAAQQPAPMDTTKPSEVYLYNWSDYMAPGTKKGFEKETGIKVVETYFDDNEALLAKLKAGATGYDVIVPSDYMVHIMIMTELLDPLDMDLHPELRSTWTSSSRTPVYDDPVSPRTSGNKYSVPYQWGTTGYAVRTDKLGADTYGTWKQLFPPDDDTLKGQINMLNDERETLGAAPQDAGLLDQHDRPGAARRGHQTAHRAEAAGAPVRLGQHQARHRQGMPLTMCWNGDALLAIDAMGGDAGQEGQLRAARRGLRLCGSTPSPCRRAPAARTAPTCSWTTSSTPEVMGKTLELDLVPAGRDRGRRPTATRSCTRPAHRRRHAARRDLQRPRRVRPQLHRGLGQGEELLTG